MMKKAIAILLVCSLTLCGCTSRVGNNYEGSNHSDKAGQEESSSTVEESSAESLIAEESETNSYTMQDIDYSNNYSSLSDPEFLTYMEDVVYTDLVAKIDSTDYFVENVEAVYISKEYTEELEYNSQSNIYFGYTIDELNELFQGTRYVFTLGEDGTTTVKKFEEYVDSSEYGQILKNVAIGTGVILFCVTVSVATGGVAPAVSVIFAASAKTATTMALSSGLMSGVLAGIVTGIETGDWDAALYEAAAQGSEGFKWGAIFGAIQGGAGKASQLFGATRGGLTMNEVATIQKESKYPLDVIKQFSSMEQYQVCKEAGLTCKMVNGKLALIRDIDLNFVDELGRTNWDRMVQGLSALDPKTGHHMNFII